MTVKQEGSATVFHRTTQPPKPSIVSVRRKFLIWFFRCSCHFGRFINLKLSPLGPSPAIPTSRSKDPQNVEQHKDSTKSVDGPAWTGKACGDLPWMDRIRLISTFCNTRYAMTSDRGRSLCLYAEVCAKSCLSFFVQSNEFVLYMHILIYIYTECIYIVQTLKSLALKSAKPISSSFQAAKRFLPRSTYCKSTSSSPTAGSLPPDHRNPAFLYDPAEAWKPDIVWYHKTGQSQTQTKNDTLIQRFVTLLTQTLRKFPCKSKTVSSFISKTPGTAPGAIADGVIGCRIKPKKKWRKDLVINSRM